MLAIAFCCSLAVGAGFAASAEAQPNILFIVTDDQARDTMAAMPQTQQWFGDQGTHFPKGVATTPLCCPARASIFTGRYAHNHGVTDNSKAECLGQTEDPTIGPDPACGYTTAVPNPQRTTLQYYLQQNGYRTAIYGKYLNAWPLDLNPPFFDDWAVHNNSPYTPAQSNEQGMRKWVWEYTPNYVARQARDFLQRTHDQSPNQPWFLYIAPESPHSPHFPEQKHAEASVPPLQPNPDSYFEADRKDKPSWIQQSIGSDEGTVYDEDALQHAWTEHMRMLRSADELVDGVMQKIQSLGEDQNTLAFYISDNGYMWGEHGLTLKLRPYLESIQVPFFLRWPGWAGHSGGESSNQLVSNIDLGPTALQAAGVDPVGLPTQMDGRSVIDAAPQVRNRNLTEGWGADTPAPGVFPTWAAIRTPTFHYIESYETTRNPDGTVQSEDVIFREYYDLVNDPSEVTNLLGDSSAINDPPTAALSAQLASDRACGGQACPGRDPSSLLIDTAITEKPDAASAKDVRFSFTSTEPNSTFRCKLNRGIWKACASPISYSRGLRGGKNTFQVRSNGPAGALDGTPAKHTWTVDYSPDTRLTEVPPKISDSRDATFRFESPVATTSTVVECTLQTPIATTTEDCTSPKTYTALPDGNYTFTARSVDRVRGKQDPHPQTHTWSIDATEPETQVQPDSNVCQPAPTGTAVTCPNVVHGSSMTLYPSTNESPAERFECSLDDAPYTVCSKTKTYTRLGGGTHTVRVRATDLAGNTDSTPAILTWEVGSLQSFATSPDVTWPQIIDGSVVKAIASDGTGGWYVGGDFTTVGLPGVLTSAHTDLVHINSNATIDEAWNPGTGNGEVRSLVVANGNLYVGGTFTSVRGTNDPSPTARNRLAAISLTGATRGQLTAWNPNANGAVSVLMDGAKRVSGATVRTIYAGGGFTALGSGAGTVTRNRVAELDPTSGLPTPWNPSIGGSHVYALAVTPSAPTDCALSSCGYVYAGGDPDLLVEIDRAGSGEITSWDPSPNGAVRALKIRIGSLGGLPTLYAGGQFTQIGNPQSVQRYRAAEINLSDDGSATSWDPSIGLGGVASGQVNAFVPFHCSAVFTGTPSLEPACTTIVGGEFDSMKVGGPSPVSRSRLGETDRVTGNPNDWDPSLSQSVFALACFPSSPLANPTNHCQTDPQILATNRVLAVGGSFTTVGGAARKGLAFFRAPSVP